MSYQVNTGVKVTGTSEFWSMKVDVTNDFQTTGTLTTSTSGTPPGAPVINGLEVDAATGDILVDAAVTTKLKDLDLSAATGAPGTVTKGARS